MLKLRAFRLVVLCALALASMPFGTHVAQAATNTLRLQVRSARTEPKANGGAGVHKGDLVTSYKFIINQNNVGNPAQSRSPDCSPSTSSYPANCNWPSIQAQQGFAPIVTQGDNSNLNATTGITLPPGKYLVSVLADGHKIDGQWFSVPFSGDGLVTVDAQPLPLPTATLRAKVFEDNAIVNGAPDVPVEHGLAGFRATISDPLGEVTTDVFGNPLCTQYELNSDGTPNPDAPIAGTGGQCLSDANGDVVIPNMGPNRYAMAVTAPNGTNWVQTTTLEGNKDWDTWVQEGATGYDTEFSIAGELFPSTIFGYVKPRGLSRTGTGEIKGVVAGAKTYTPLNGGLPYNGGVWGGLSGSKIDQTVDKPWIALNDLNNGDVAVYVGRGNADGSFSIKNVPNGNYTLTYWDDQLNYILDVVNVTVNNGQVVDTGVLFLAGWFTKVEGKVCNDQNGNGKCDSGEPGLSGFAVAVKRRTNSVMDRGATTVLTGADGSYVMENLYPLTQWLVLEAYSDRFYTVGYTYQTDNQPSETTVLGAGVDVNILPIIGQSGRLDWAVRPYDPTGATGLRNGGIVGSVSYDTTRNELDPRYAAVENWQVGIPNLTVDLYAPIACASGDADCAKITGATSYYKTNADGSLQRGQLLNSYLTEQWARPRNCQARDVDGKPVDQQVLPPATGNYECLEGPLMGVQFGEEYTTVDGNYGFTDACFGAGGYDPNANNGAGGCADGSDPTALPAGDYLVNVVIPDDDFGKPAYQVTKEEDINVFDGDQYTPQIPPSPCAGAMHTVDVAGVGSDGPDAVDNPAFAEAGGSPYEGQQKPLCDVKLVTVSNGRSVAPGFNLFTPVPLPGRYYGYIVDDLNLSTNPQDLLFGEKAGVANSPIGVYDFANRLVTTVNSDPNGIFEVLLPSTNTINCPSPSGVCASLYRLVGNDPGVPGKLNPNYNPSFRTIAATFEVFPGDIIPADLAPTQIGVSIQAPGSQFNAPAQCLVSDAQPQLFAVDKPYVTASDTGTARNITLKGLGFGATQGSGSVVIDGAALSVVSWSDRQIVVGVPTGAAVGPHQLMIKASNGLQTVNGLTFHVLGTGYTPTVRSVGPGKTYATIQAAINASGSGSNLIVVYPGGVADSSNPAYNPQKAYFENLIITSMLKLQGVGPGGVYSDGSVIEGSVIDGAAFGGDTALADAWRTKVANSQWDGNQNVYEGAVITILARSSGSQAFGSTFPATIDGFGIQGGDQQGFPNNINLIGGTPTGLPPAVEVQGGGIYANAYATNLRITNNVLQSNGGAYGGAVRLGTPHLAADAQNAPFADNNNNNVRIANNRILANGGTNLAGAIGIFTGADNYDIGNNDFCGNFSAEYGGAISHYGLSPNGKIHDNRIWFNRSYDEGGAIMIAGELPANPSALSAGAGPVDIYNNLIQSNLANDDGGGVRFLMAGNFPYNVYNNMIVNNISTHEGGGIAIDDAPNMRVYNNTIMKNITTATAATSNGAAMPAGLSTASNSTALQNTLPAGSPTFSKPLLFNNIFWDNRAGSWNGGGVAGIGLQGDPNAIKHWDMGVADNTGTLAPTSSMLQTTDGTTADASNKVNVDPQVAILYDTSVAVYPWRGNPTMVGAAIVAVDLPPNRMGNYHIQSASPAKDAGAANKAVPSYQQQPTTLSAPTSDIDGEARPGGSAFDMGADELAGTVAPPPAVAMPALPVLDTFDRANAWTLNTTNWSQGMRTSSTTCGSSTSVTCADIRVHSNQAYAYSNGQAIWNTPSGGFGGDQGAALTFVNDPLFGTGLVQPALILKATGATVLPTNYIRVAYTKDTSNVTWATVASTTNSGSNFTTHGNLAATLAAGDTLTAFARSNNTVQVWKTSAGATTYLGSVNVPSTFTSGRIGMRLPTGQRVENFSGGYVQNNVAGFATPILDSFTRANSASLGGSWIATTTPFDISNNQAIVTGSNGMAVWNGSTPGGKQDARLTIRQIGGDSVGLLLKVNGLSNNQFVSGSSYVSAVYTRSTGTVAINTKAANASVAVRATITGVSLAAGDILSATAVPQGSNVVITVLKNGAPIGNTTVAGFTGSGKIGMTASTPSSNGLTLDDFGGGTLP